MTSALQRQEPGDPRAKAIEAMARAEREVARRVYDGHDKRAEALLAALEAEGWGLTSTREGERLREALDRISRMPYERGDGWAKARSAAREALSSVPVEEEERA